MIGNHVWQGQKAIVKPSADNAGRLDGQTASQEASQQGSGNPHPLQDRALLSDGEIRDPLGNFSEQVGAYFG